MLKSFLNLFKEKRGSEIDYKIYYVQGYNQAIKDRAEDIAKQIQNTANELLEEYKAQMKIFLKRDDSPEALVNNELLVGAYCKGTEHPRPLCTDFIHVTPDSLLVQFRIDPITSFAKFKLKESK